MNGTGSNSQIKERSQCPPEENFKEQKCTEGEIVIQKFFPRLEIWITLRRWLRPAKLQIFHQLLPVPKCFSFSFGQYLRVGILRMLVGAVILDNWRRKSVVKKWSSNIAVCCISYNICVRLFAIETKGRPHRIPHQAKQDYAWQTDAPDLTKLSGGLEMRSKQFVNSCIDGSWVCYVTHWNLESKCGRGNDQGAECCWYTFVFFIDRWLGMANASTGWQTHNSICALVLRTITLERVSPKIPKKSLFPIYTFDFILREMTMRRTRLTYDKILADIQSLSRDHGWIGQDLPDPLVVSVWLLLFGKYFIVGQTCTFWKMYNSNWPE